MEPVPETERMEEFRSSPLPTLRLVSTDLDNSRKPPTIRRSTEPPSPSSPVFSASASFQYKPRTASPLSGLHTRSKSTASLTPLSMGRTRSMPGVDGAGRILYPPQLRPASPSGSPSRYRVPRKPVDEVYPPPSPVRSSVLDNDRQQADRSSSPTPSLSSSSTIPSYKRASSPFRHGAYPSPITSFAFPGPVSFGTASPSFRSEGSATGYSFSYYPSSVPSTPSSMRSRSPSISSLETIPDTPDAEEAAVEAERIAQLKAAADAVDGGDNKGRTSLDVPIRGRTLGIGSRDKRKRWSVCGAERRGDLDLETIWED
ncbi:putative basic proline-rich protein [Rosellinia necatrix]|uniref:Putative basic proline-rich protein n=1 Tax=Rosellinia necatrix TaxID=77044 RepID=A0A1S7UJM8_ROSNE|nr:putative basic proline-rich protein [Rosellinia necatrix]